LLLKFVPERFEDNWRAALEDIRDDKHTFLCFLSDGDYQWKPSCCSRSSPTPSSSSDSGRTAGQPS
jgi:hypothetical protein